MRDQRPSGGASDGGDVMGINNAGQIVGWTNTPVGCTNPCAFVADPVAKLKH
jgi:hypothetical protein